ncbi:MAG TPA: serine/threonine protein kinase, partial [Verrucomicrobiae bacterium]
DLDWIVMKALEKERQRRYETANALAMDVRRYLDNEPVNARPPSQLYRLQKLIQRNKVICACVLVVTLTLIAGLEVSTSFFFEERQARMEAEQAHANEMLLQKKAKAREVITECSVLLSHDAVAEADKVADAIPVELLSPSREGSDVFRRLGLWNLYQRNWKQAANRYIALLQVNQVDKNDRTDQVYDLLFAAPILIEAGDIADYERIRRAALTRMGNTTSPNAAEQLMKTSLLLPADDSILEQLVPLERIVVDTLKSHDPAVNDQSLLAAWRTLALALLEYRRGNFSAAVSELQVCLNYQGQSPACIASSHLLLSMALHQLGKIERADLELEQGRTMVQNRFKQKLESGDDKTGRIQGWIVTPILLHEAESLSNTAAWLQSDDSE